LTRTLLETVEVKDQGRLVPTQKSLVVVKQIVNRAMQGDYFSIALIDKYVGVDRKRKESRQHGGLSHNSRDDS
jgi:hypothetical protein